MLICVSRGVYFRTFQLDSYLQRLVKLTFTVRTGRGVSCHIFQRLAGAAQKYSLPDLGFVGVCNSLGVITQRQSKRQRAAKQQKKQRMTKTQNINYSKATKTTKMACVLAGSRK